MGAQFVQGIVAELPWHNGDGYSWGGDIVVSFGRRAVTLGSTNDYGERQERLALGRLIAEAPTMVAALRNAVSDDILPEPLFLEVAAILARIDGEGL